MSHSEVISRLQLLKFLEGSAHIGFDSKLILGLKAVVFRHLYPWIRMTSIWNNKLSIQILPPKQNHKSDHPVPGTDAGG